MDKGLLLGTVTVAQGTLQIDDAFEKVYVNTLPGVQQTISQEQSDSYQSPTAQSDLSQAVSYYNQAQTLANQGQWQNAVSDLNQANSYASQAAAAEQSYTPPTHTGNNLGGNSVGSGQNGSGSHVFKPPKEWKQNTTQQ